MTTDTQTPPERCPVCGAEVRNDWPPVAGEKRPHQRRFDCDASWMGVSGEKWYRPCSNAMTAALRCGATLEPTPLELARQALVDAAELMDDALMNGDTFDMAAVDLARARANYRALLEPAP